MNEHLDILVERARRHDPDALAELCERLYPELYRYIAYRVGGKEDAEDLTSELFLRMVRSIKNLKGSIRGWIYRIAENLVTDYYRRRAVRRGVIGEIESPDTMPSPQADPSRGLLAGDLQRGMRTLTAEQYQVVTLKFLEGYSTEEIAAFLGKSTGAVKALQFRALQGLRGFFTEDDRHE
ncbi:MAG TPA: sigma-70 family RNA polymerase sigma factor [Bacteroidetes bacterium]|nr:sigma-70 family RNA polymerase sigma factor [Bacteroidota bacterium]